MSAAATVLKTNKPKRRDGVGQERLVAPVSQAQLPCEPLCFQRRATAQELVAELGGPHVRFGPAARRMCVYVRHVSRGVSGASPVPSVLQVKREALASYSHEQLEAKLEGYGFKKASYERDEFFDPEPKPKSSSAIGGLELYLPRLISTSGVSERVGNAANDLNGQRTASHHAGMPAGRRMGQGFMRGDEA
jgi:hypothetical protein